jgi:hypothetical protein
MATTEPLEVQTPERKSVAILRRELIFLGIALAAGFVLIPLAIWLVGNRILGAYTHAQDPTAGTGPARLLADFFAGLSHGSVIFWCVALGPLLLISLARLFWGAIRHTSPDSTSTH